MAIVMGVYLVLARF